jgi:heat shock protein HtpX
MEKISFYDQMSKNKRDSVLLGILVFSSLIGLVYVIAEIFTPGFSFGFLTFAGIIIILYSYASYSYGDKVVLAATRAIPIKENDRKYIHLINVVEGLSIAAGIPKPKIYVIESNEMNAFATGKDPQHASIAVTTGLLNNLKRDELEGVIGHEMSHIRNYDIRFATYIAVLVGLVAILSDVLMRSFWYGGGRRDRDEEKGFGLLIIVGLILAIFAPIIVRLVQFAVSRRREFLADASSAELTRYPEGLASALEKIMENNEGKMKISEAVSHLFFVDPNKSALDSLYATHPPIKERIKILRSM